MRFIESAEAAIPDLLTIADLLKKQRPALTDFEALRIAVEIWKADTLETLDEFASYLDGTHNMFPIPVSISQD
jgi:hypothetical protein